ncbi:ADP-ribosylglycohydrolase [Entamoeba marina]
MKQNTNSDDAAKEVFKQQFLEYAKQLRINSKKTYRETDVRLTPKEAEQFVKNNYQKRCPLVSSYLPSLPDVFQPLPIPENRNPYVRDCFVGMFFGQAIGDAVGLATEFLTKDQAEWYYGTERIDYKKMLPDRHRVRWMNQDLITADWTDDTDQAILILDSIVRNNGKIDVHDFARRAYFWTAFGFPEIGDIAGLGIGNTFGSTVTANGFLKDPIKSTKSVWLERNKPAPNGAVMRTCAVLAAGWEDANELVRNARTIASVTHADPRCLASVEVIVRILMAFFDGRTNVENIINESRACGRMSLKDDEYRKQFDKFTNPNTLKDLDLNEFIGFTFKPVGCAVWALRKAVKLLCLGVSRVEIFEVIIMDIVREAGDADTNAAVVGAVLGSYLGPSCLPQKWMQFKNLDWYKNRINRVLKLHQLPTI